MQVLVELVLLLFLFLGDRLVVSLQRSLGIIDGLHVVTGTRQELNADGLAVAAAEGAEVVQHNGVAALDGPGGVDSLAHVDIDPAAVVLDVHHRVVDILDQHTCRMLFLGAAAQQQGKQGYQAN